MRLEQAVQIRNEIAALLLARVEGYREDEKEAVTMAAAQLEQFGCMGGATRSCAEAEIVRLVRRFDDTQDSSFGPWPVSDFMATERAKGEAYKNALLDCIKAHKSGRYEPLVAAVEASEKLIEDLSE